MSDQLVLPRLDAEIAAADQTRRRPAPPMGRRATFGAAVDRPPQALPAHLVLLPVNLAGVLKSLQQAVTGDKIPVARTPKVKDRTAAPAIYVLTPYAIVAFSLLTVWRDAQLGNWGNVAFASLNAVLAAGAIRAYIGVINSAVDAFLGMVNWLYVSPRPKKVTHSPVVAKTAEEFDWETILYHGDRRLNRDLRGSADRRRRISVR
jgi:cellulose synthase (UDP-forming)